MAKPANVKVKVLGDYSRVANAFREIQMDQAISGQEIMLDAPLHYWEPIIDFTEKLFKRLASKKLGKFMPEMLRMPGYEDLTPDDGVVDLIVMSINDSTELLLKKAGCSKIEIWAVSHMLNEFFEGSLRDQFEYVIKGSPADKVFNRDGQVRREVRKK